MGGGRNSSTAARSLGGVIFGCTHSTMKECLSNLVFGLPAVHLSYIQNIWPGMPIFLFNYSDRKLHGIFEAATHGKMNINPYGWTENGSGKTHYPAQVRVRIRKQCQSLSEEQYKKVIHDNYYDNVHFRFELDQIQTSKLIFLFESSPMSSSTATFSYNVPIRKSFQGAVPIPETRKEDRVLKKLGPQEDSSQILNTESGFPAESPRPIKWISLFRETSDSDARSDDEGIKPLVSEASWEEESVVYINGSNTNPAPSGVTTCWDEGEGPSGISCWADETWSSGDLTGWDDEETGPSCSPTFSDEESRPSGVTPWDEEKQISGTQLDKEATEDEEERIFSKLKQMTLDRENSNSEAHTGDACVPCGRDYTRMEEEHSPAAPSEPEENLNEEQAENLSNPCRTGNSQLDECSPAFVPCERDYPHMEDEHCPATPSKPEENLNLEEQAENLFISCRTDSSKLDECSSATPSASDKEDSNSGERLEDCEMDNSRLEDAGSPTAPSTPEKESSDSEEQPEGYEMDNSNLENAPSPRSGSEKENLNSDEQTEDDFATCGTDNSQLENVCSPAALLASEKCEDLSTKSSNIQSVIFQLKQELEEVKAISMGQHKKTSAMEKKLDYSEALVQQLRQRVMLLESHLPSAAGVVSRDSCSIEKMTEQFDKSRLGNDELIFIMGGYDGVSWLPTVDCYSPSEDIVRTLTPMSSVRSYASAAVLNGLIYNFGGWNGYSGLWYDTAECYNPLSNEWHSCPPMREKKGCLASACLNNKIYAVGGGNGIDCFKEVEMFDPVLGRWIPTQSMFQKRFASAAAELDGVLYIVGGYDGNTYLKSAERFDPREASWSKLQSMNTSRGSHTLTAFKGKLYALGGYDGNAYVPSIEVFDPCMGSWLAGDEMKQSRGYFVAPVIGEAIYAIGGQTEGNNMVDAVETYRIGHGWSVSKLKGIGKRCFFSAILH
ncbi:hypothetical protein IFM89_008671 [Coptis chinensis]|uniref:DCD domain-containing protein n=1 Tax=Coptis chinensis TaxID=261450 RepID=A0A835ICZ3_9MAGN|nr:hypothetical protein IFM89_008671 [Coptis chinensis]